MPTVKEHLSTSSPAAMKEPGAIRPATWRRCGGQPHAVNSIASSVASMPPIDQPMSIWRKRDSSIEPLSQRLITKCVLSRGCEFQRDRSHTSADPAASAARRFANLSIIDASASAPSTSDSA